MALDICTFAHLSQHSHTLPSDVETAAEYHPGKLPAAAPNRAPQPPNAVAAPCQAAAPTGQHPPSSEPSPGSSSSAKRRSSATVRPAASPRLPVSPASLPTPAGKPHAAAGKNVAHQPIRGHKPAAGIPARTKSPRPGPALKAKAPHLTRSPTQVPETHNPVLNHTPEAAGAPVPGTASKAAATPEAETPQGTQAHLHAPSVPATGSQQHNNLSHQGQLHSNQSAHSDASAAVGTAASSNPGNKPTAEGAAGRVAAAGLTPLQRLQSSSRHRSEAAQPVATGTPQSAQSPKQRVAQPALC